MRFCAATSSIPRPSTRKVVTFCFSSRTTVEAQWPRSVSTPRRCCAVRPHCCTLLSVHAQSAIASAPRKLKRRPAAAAAAPVCCRIAHVGTLPSHQKRGLAQALLDEALRVARDELGCKGAVALTTTSVQQAACRLYERNGFRCVARQSIGFGLHILEYERVL